MIVVSITTNDIHLLQDLTYPKDYNGSKPLYELECKPLKKYGEFCYYNPPAEFCPCETRCVSNGFYGHCL